MATKKQKQPRKVSVLTIVLVSILAIPILWIAGAYIYDAFFYPTNGQVCKRDMANYIPSNDPRIADEPSVACLRDPNERYPFSL